MQPVILASASPRRLELLGRMGVPCEVVPSTVDESAIPADHPRTFAIRAAYAKAMDVAARSPEGRLVLAADTVVTLDGLLFGKPVDDLDARRLLTRLSGRTHTVITAVALAHAGRPEVALDSETTEVTFRTLADRELEAYLATGEHRDKAGAYGIQGAAGIFVSAIQGDYHNVVGLPCSLVAAMLERAGLGGVKVPPQPTGHA